MAVVNIREVYPGVSLGLWQMDETAEQLFGQYPHLQAYRSQVEERYKNDGRKLEFLAIRALMYEKAASPNRLQEMLHNRSHLSRCLRQRSLQCHYQGEGGSRFS